MIEGNFENKYEAKNPLKKIFVKNFLLSLIKLGRPAGNRPEVLEVGCGEGYLLEVMRKNYPQGRYWGIDLSGKMVSLAQRKNPQAKIIKANAEQLPFKNNRFDLVLLCEVLEHLENPVRAIAEASRVTKQNCLFSIPLEPWWRILNLLRLKYVSGLGNTPGHINHWTPKQFISQIKPYFKNIELQFCFPWIMVKTSRKNLL
ncbi:MAG: class I SAM-dependent methyltransferase [Candidatus Pacebacteria bacterium]|nr:class I SAM-dependent methyltransferase [Candidatus Paceibacterota bacterium]